MAESSSAETSTSSNFSGSSHITNFSAHTSEVEFDSELSEAGPSSRVVSLLNHLKSPALCGIMTFFERMIGINLKNYQNNF